MSNDKLSFRKVREVFISKLKENSLPSAYFPHEESPGWLKGLGDISSNDLGVLALLKPVGVEIRTTDGNRILLKPDAPSVYLAGLAGKVRSFKMNISVGLPPLARDLPLFLACTSVLCKILEKDTSVEISYNRGILVVSPDTVIRSLYCDLLVNKEPLESALAGSRLQPNGKVQPLSRTNVHNIFSGVCFFMPHRKAYPKDISILADLIILDLRYARLSHRATDLVNWTTSIPNTGVLALYTLGDRQSQSALEESDFLDFPLDHIGIQTCEDNVSQKVSDTNTSYLDINLLGAKDALSRQHIVKEISLSSELRKCLDSLAKLFFDNRENHHPEINRLRWLFSVYSQLPVPLVWYESAARERGRWVPKNVIKKIGSNTRDIGELGPVLQTFRVIFTMLNSLYEQRNPKAEEIRDFILSVSDELTKENRLLIIVRDEVMENALSSWLSLSEFLGKDWQCHIDIISCKKYLKYSNKKYTYFISAGPLHYRYRWILGGNVGRLLHFIVYPHEIEITQKQINQFYDNTYLDRRAERRLETINRIGHSGPNRNAKENMVYPILNISSPNVQVKPKSKKELKQRVDSFKDLRALIDHREEQKEFEKQALDIDLDAVYEDTTEEDVPEYSLGEISSLAHVKDGVMCFELTVSSNERGKGQIWINKDQCVEYIRPSDSEELFRTGPEKLKVDDLLLIVDEAQQYGIFDRLIEISDSNPRMQYVAVYRNIWRKAIDLLSAKFQKANGKIDYSLMHDELRNAGITITSILTLRNWVNDFVIGPEDLSSIIAVGNVSGILEMSNKAKKFDKTFSKIRSLHRSIGRRVASIIRNTFKIVATQEDINIDDDLEDYLGVPLNEIVDAVEIVEVLNITQAEEGIDPDLVGRFIKIEEDRKYDS
ncbi:MAG: hypothetical protein GY941_05355 [Planctomycetes bacterium]|nr:hypothetical protein [Planctomycetota bacterium]